MGFRFRKSLKIAPGVRLNVGTKSAGLSFGGKGLRYSVNTSGRKTASVGIPGSGLSYTTSVSGKRQYKSAAYQKQSELEKIQKEIQKLEELQRAKFEVDVYENQLELIHSIHKECDDFIDWNQIYKVERPYQIGEKGRNELAALKKYENYKPNFFHWLFKMDEKMKTKLKDARFEAKKSDLEEFDEWQELHDLAKKMINRDVDAYLQVIEEMAPLDDLSEFGSGFEFFAEEPHFIEVEFDVCSDDTVPTQTKMLTKTGKLSVKEMSKTKFYVLYQDYVCSCTLRIARDMFAILPIDYIYIHAIDHVLNTATGHMENMPILSVKIEREILNKLNFETIDCSDSMQNFEHKMNFKKTKGFEPVDKLI